jgi:DNA polymerase I-like protein with 3'-5' exonuclease and polymerase domains
MKVIALDLETTGLDPRTDKVRLAQIYDGSEVKIHDVFETPETMDYLVRLVEDSNICVVGHNLKFDLSFIRAHAGRRLYSNNIHDTLLAEQVLMAGWYQPYFDVKHGELKKRYPEYSLQALVQRHLGFKLEKDMQRSNWGSAELTKEQLIYAARDVEVLLPLYEIQKKLLDMNQLTHIAELEFQTVNPIVEIEYHGMGFDWPAAERLRETKLHELEQARQELESEARGRQKSKQLTLFGSDAGVDINFRSPIQITKYIKDKLGLDVDSSDVETLKGIDHPFAAKLLKFRGIEKQIQFIKQFEEFGGRSGRLYPYYNQCRAATGRMSSARPNGQQIPKRGEGKVFRTLFRAMGGHKLVKVDFSAIEMRVMARLAQDRAMMDAIITGTDLHKLTASKTSNKEMDQVTKDDRQKAKAVNFGLIYGMSAPTLKKYAWFNYGVRMTEQEAEDTRNAFFNLYKGIAKWHIQEKRHLSLLEPYYQHKANEGFVELAVSTQRTLLGRKRFWPSYSGETQAKPTEFYNSSDQGTSADITKLSLVRLYTELPEAAHIVGAVHDEIIVECPETIAEDISQLMLKVMREEGSRVLAPVPVDAEAVISETWG